MNQRIRILALLGVACLLAFGSVGDSQTPAGGLPPWNLQTATDANALRVALESTRGEWVAAFDKQQTLRDLCFRPLLTTSLERFFIGSVRAEVRGHSAANPATASRRQQRPPVASLSGPTSGTYTLGYLHILGSGCQTPPDQVYTAFAPTTAATPSSARNSLETRDQYDYLLHVLEGLAGHSTDPGLVGLHSWWVGQAGLRLTNFRITQNGAQFSCELRFESSGFSGTPDPVHFVHSHRLPGGGFGMVVVK